MRRELDADVYDALELSALAAGGVGAYSLGDIRTKPCCILGHALFLDASGEGEVRDVLIRVFAGASIVDANNQAVEAVNSRDGVLPLSARVPFSAWCRELNVVRRPAPSRAGADR